MAEKDKPFTPEELEQIRNLPTYQPNTPYTKATKDPAPVAEEPKKKK